MAEVKKAGFIQKLNDFSKTPTGKVVLILVVIFVLLFFCLFVFLMYNLAKVLLAPKKIEVKEEKAEEKAVPKPKEEAKKEVEKEEEKVEEEKPIDVKTFEVYEYRNPFKPTVELTIEEEEVEATGTATGTTTATGVTETTGGPVPLSLEDIYSENGTTYANVVYGGTSYQVTTGERINDSPYQVQAIGTDSITLLYGDDTIVLRLGETILK